MLGFLGRERKCLLNVGCLHDTLGRHDGAGRGGADCSLTKGKKRNSRLQIAVRLIAVSTDGNPDCSGKNVGKAKPLAADPLRVELFRM